MNIILMPKQQVCSFHPFWGDSHGIEKIRHKMMEQDFDIQYICTRTLCVLFVAATPTIVLSANLKSLSHSQSTKRKLIRIH